MSEVIVAKAGGTSNRDAEAVLQSMEWAEQANIFVVSAPGKLESDDLAADKVTNLLLSARSEYRRSGAVPAEISDAVTERFFSIVKDLGSVTAMPVTWVDRIPARVEESVRHSEHTASMLGEALQAEVYAGAGFHLLDPGRATHELGSDPQAWRAWLQPQVNPSEKYVLPGNTTLYRGHLQTFSRGGSDTSGGLASFAVKADRHWNLTDDAAYSADPRLINRGRLNRIDHLLYEEGRELGRNGTGLLHPAAMVPLMLGGIPTEIRSTFDKDSIPTIVDNDELRAEKRIGKVAALSLMESVSMFRIHEPGMAEAAGRVAAFDNALADNGIAIVDTQGDGVDAQNYYVSSEHAEIAEASLKEVTQGRLERSGNLSFVTLVGYRLKQGLIDTVVKLSEDVPGFREVWQAESHDFSNGRHSLRLGFKPDEAEHLLHKIHRAVIEKQ